MTSERGRVDWNLTSEQDFEQMYREYFPRIYNYVFYRLLSREETEDIVSEVFLKIARNASRFDTKKASFKTWIYTIAKNALTDYYRAKKAALSLDGEDYGIALSVDFEEQLNQISSPDRKILYQELAALKERERTMVYYKYFEGYNNRQIAAILDMNESTVATVLFRALKKLRAGSLREAWTE